MKGSDRFRERLHPERLRFRLVVSMTTGWRVSTDRDHALAGRAAHRRTAEPLAVLVVVRTQQLIGRWVVPADADVAGLEHLAQLVADEVDDRLEVELGRHPLLDAVDHRELGGALLGFLQQPLRLVEEARVLERDAHRVARAWSADARPIRRTRARARIADADRRR